MQVIARVGQVMELTLLTAGFLAEDRFDLASFEEHGRRPIIHPQYYVHRRFWRKRTRFRGVSRLGLGSSEAARGLSFHFGKGIELVPLPQSLSFCAHVLDLRLDLSRYKENKRCYLRL